MSNLNWRRADVALTDKLVPNPRAEHELQDRILNASVAVEGAFLHIDPQRGETAYPGQSEAQVTIVPATAVRTVIYRSPVGESAQIF
ncbi:hypothetical protein ACFQ6Q_14790 [Streptomyces sp. NPDC056437]|uniref:hypothetical protein n=1 Tax=Streptomyces sp. NPDC056437 TaxID=3345816 RepID=UPI00368F4529